MAKVQSRAQLDLQEGIFSSFVSSVIKKAKPEKFVVYRDGDLKGRLQARLPATQGGLPAAPGN